MTEKKGVVTAKDLSSQTGQSVSTCYRELKDIKETFSIKKVFWHHVKHYYNIQISQ